jgi:hypothetical protein
MREIYEKKEAGRKGEIKDSRKRVKKHYKKREEEA